MRISAEAFHTLFSSNNPAYTDGIISFINHSARLLKAAVFPSLHKFNLKRPVRRAQLIIPYYRWGDEAQGRLTKLPNVTQLTHGGAGFEPRLSGARARVSR